MVSIQHLRAWLLAAPVSGAKAICYTLIAVLLPTLINVSVEDVVTYVPLTPYIPFVLFIATFIGWRHAAGVALAAALIADFWFIGPPRQMLEGPTDIFTVTSFLVVASILIAFGEAVRRLAGINAQVVRPNRALPGTIVFSLEGGVAWASWYGTEAPVRLGPEDEVAAMMEDFLAQRQIGRQLLTSRY